MRRLVVCIVFLLLAAQAGGCAPESPLGPRGKSKLAGPRCAPSDACPDRTSF